MNVFNTHRQIVNDYAQYIRSFINISDPEIARKVEDSLSEGRLWPQPLLQFNPAYEQAGTVEEVIASGLLHDDVRHIFDGYSLYRHQCEAIELGVRGRDFVVTSGTGSGKSLTYIGTIFNHLLTDRRAEGIAAVIVYPMNALINSQTNEFNTYKNNYESSTERDFPITFGQYTGQEKEERRQAMREDPPQILLTNYMMLELLLTRVQERPIREAIFENLRHLVFDELHTYRGRQGADVSMLIRRIQSQCKQSVCCIGTSATMVSVGSAESQRSEVARVARTVFGRPFGPDQIVDETLARSLDATGTQPSKQELHAAITAPIDADAGETELRKHPVAIWLENRIALKEHAVSLLAVHKGEWSGPRMLDNQPATIINAFFEESDELGDPLECPEGDEAMFMGTIYLGDGFVLDENQSTELYTRGVSNGAIRSLLNGKEVNSSPRQMPKRKIIFLEQYETLHEAKSHEPVAVDHLRTHVLPDRLAQKNERAKARWWRYYRFNEVCYQNLRSLEACFVAAATTKHLSFSAMPTDYIFTHALYVFTTDRWDLFAVVQSTLHEVWARKYSGALKQDLRYSPSKCFDTFAFPVGLWKTTDPGLAKLGERYHTHRKELMQSLWLGLTKIYNLFHARDLSVERVAKISKKDADTAAAGFEALLEMRRLHVALDIAVRDAYGWQDLDLEHAFHEVETLPENDRVRYTINPIARREVLKRLLAENHARAGAEAKNPSPRPTRGSRKRKAVAGPDLFRGEF